MKRLPGFARSSRPINHCLGCDAMGRPSILGNSFTVWASKIFSALADALLWCMYAAGVTSTIHYVGEFLCFGHPDSERSVASKSGGAIIL